MDRLYEWQDLEVRDAEGFEDPEGKPRMISDLEALLTQISGISQTVSLAPAVAQSDPA